MNVSKIGLNTQSYPNKVGFKGEETYYENPVSRRTERNLAILTSATGACVLGALVGGASSLIVPTEKIAEGEKNLTGFLKAKKFPVLIGAAAAAVTLAVTLPAKIYNTKVNAFVKQKEMDVFSRDRNLKSNLTEEVDKEVQDSEVSLDKKLDDNLKLQMANRANVVGLANVTPQS